MKKYQSPAMRLVNIEDECCFCLGSDVKDVESNEEFVSGGGGHVTPRARQRIDSDWDDWGEE